MLRLVLLSAPVSVVILVAGSLTAAALPPLEQNPRVAREFLAVAVGDEIRKNCGSISARFFRVLSKKNELENYALGLGYTRADIKAMVGDKAAKDRLKARRDDYLAAHGVQAGVQDGAEDAYCRLGREEIAKNSLTGWLLRAR